MELNGIDVSKWQGEIDWARVKEAGTEFAMIRALYGTKEDPRFRANLKGAEGNGVYAGAYVYSLAVTEDEARAEADAALELVKGAALRYPIAMDMEDERQKGLTKAMRGKLISAFCDRIAAAGRIPMIYSSRDWFDRLIPAAVTKKYPVWLAQWRAEKPETDFETAMWQSGTGSVEGIGEKVDIDVSYTDFAALTAPRAVFRITRPRLKGEAYLCMQRALNAANYRDAEGKRLEEDGVWGKRSMEAFLALLRAEAEAGVGE